MKAIACFAAGLLAGCAGCPPTQVNWYLHEDAVGPRLHLSLVHEGQRPVRVDAVTVNAGADSAGWTYRPQEPWAPGRVWVLPLDRFAGPDGPYPGCTVPVRVDLRCEGRPQARAAQTGGNLPSHLPPEWIRDCGERR
jgi:hypothetical protein